MSQKGRWLTFNLVIVTLKVADTGWMQHPTILTFILFEGLPYKFHLMATAQVLLASSRTIRANTSTAAEHLIAPVLTRVSIQPQVWEHDHNVNHQILTLEHFEFRMLNLGWAWKSDMKHQPSLIRGCRSTQWMMAFKTPKLLLRCGGWSRQSGAPRARWGPTHGASSSFMGAAALITI